MIDLHVFITYFATFLKFLILGYSLCLQFLGLALMLLNICCTEQEFFFSTQAVNFSRNSEKPATFESGGGG